MTTSIDIELYESGLVGDTLSILLEAGWEKFGGKITFQHFLSDEGPDDPIEADPQDWATVKTALNDWSASGQISM